MANVRWKWNIRELEAIRRSPAMMSKLQRTAESIRSGAGEGFTTSAVQGRTRARATVAAYTYQARKQNARENTLLRNLDRGRQW